MSSPGGAGPSATVLEQYLSTPRLSTYVRSCSGDREQAVRLYRWNASVASAFGEVLGHGEVILRNAMHEQLTILQHSRGRQREWFDDPALSTEARSDIVHARRRAGPAASPGKIVAELTFGFWRYLLAKRYAPTLWPALRHGFPHLPRAGDARRVLEGHVIDLHKLRNRIAHHEPLLSVPLQDRVASLRFTLDAINPQIRVWALDDNGRLNALLASRP